MLFLLYFGILHFESCDKKMMTRDVRIPAISFVRGVSDERRWKSIEVKFHRAHQSAKGALLRQCSNKFWRKRCFPARSLTLRRHKAENNSHQTVVPQKVIYNIQCKILSKWIYTNILLANNIWDVILLLIICKIVSRSLCNMVSSITIY